MTGIAKIMIIGRLGNDPELKYSQAQTAMCTLRVAVSEKKKEGNSFEASTEWFNVLCFGKTAENAHRYLKKGRQVYADGKLHVRKWTDKEGNTRFSLDIVANQVLFLGANRDDGQTNNYQDAFVSEKENEEYLEDAPF
ncbi:MAG: single-stranded DNA-binding protein [Deltaproteobacteria bacterium]|nr:MAG: single-stranded DNA-binding protein [Deltaproteobacteria bacterium]